MPLEPDFADTRARYAGSVTVTGAGQSSLIDAVPYAGTTVNNVQTFREDAPVEYDQEAGMYRITWPYETGTVEITVGVSKPGYGILAYRVTVQVTAQ